jgi:hypothetical protein
MKTNKAIREFICYNQKEIIQYEFLVSEKHRDLRKLVDKKNPTKEDVEKHYNMLIDTAYDGLIKIYQDNIDLINNIFKATGIPKAPKVTVKTLEDGSVLDFFRSNKPSNFDLNGIESNTGFSKIMSSPKEMFYINHDLEKSFLNGSYINPRLDEGKFKEKSVSWTDYWKPLYDGSKDEYLSTLIIPMAIRINDNDDDLFKKKFSENISHGESSRTVWGFLCFDYPEKNILKEYEEDVKDVSYIIADILSLYLMFFYNHISGSKTFSKAIKIIYGE